MCENPKTDPVQPQEVERRAQDAADLLEAIVEDRALLSHLDPALRKRLLIASGRVSKPSKQDRRRLARAHQRRDKLKRRHEDEALLDQTGIRRLRENPIFLTPRRRLAAAEPAATEPLGQVHQERLCYVCQEKFTQVHHFYDQMCLRCGDFNYEKRDPQGDLSGRVALVTGARVKIGYQAAIMLLRAGCAVIVLTRFPRDAARRYAAEEDFDQWSHRLEIHGVDLRHIPSVEALCQHLLETHERLDFLINNACQTVRRPPGFYNHLMERELGELDALPQEQRALLANAEPSGQALVAPGGQLPAAALSQIPLVPGDRENSGALFPEGALDADEQQIDLRTMNSWRLRLAEVPTVEMLEVQLVNAVAPFLLNARLKPLMLRVPSQDKHIVNVSAMEGQFYRNFKSDKHPHTNMAKAALNMMTRTAALDYIEDGIHMNSVDTGWVTDEDPVVLAQRKREIHRFHPPLDIVDGAARIVDPIFSGLATGEHTWGQFLKDYRPADW
jgi:NAD(P)-dependent dehydrogenase (short-subunit alcohol dehydrogenase family)